MASVSELRGVELPPWIHTEPKEMFSIERLEKISAIDAAYSRDEFLSLGGKFNNLRVVRACRAIHGRRYVQEHPELLEVTTGAYWQIIAIDENLCLYDVFTDINGNRVSLEGNEFEIMVSRCEKLRTRGLDVLVPLGMTPKLVRELMTAMRSARIDLANFVPVVSETQGLMSDYRWIRIPEIADTSFHGNPGLIAIEDLSMFCAMIRLEQRQRTQSLKELADSL